MAGNNINPELPFYRSSRRSQNCSNGSFLKYYFIKKIPLILTEKNMKVLVISGFLGSGKTTFIKQMIKATNREYVIFENEFGDVNIDGEILKKSVNQDKTENEEINVWELSSGCACCSTKADFMSSLLVIDNTLNPDFLIVEPSGIALLSNILNNVKKIGYERIELLAPITVIDAQTYFKYKSKYAEVFLDQISVSTHIQLSKIENLSDDELKLIADDIKTINNTANIYIGDYHKADTDYWNGLFSGELIKPDSDEIKIVKSKMKNVTFRDAHIRDMRAALFFLDKIIFNYYGEINRGKGVFKTPDYNIHFDLVDKN